MRAKITAPWTESQVASLVAHQTDSKLPYTCVCSGENVLQPKIEGLVCPRCGYRQMWAFSETPT